MSISNNIKVSVIIPMFNVESYVEKAVQSIMNQSLKEIEIIVVNDGSTDKSLDIVNRLAQGDERIKIVSTSNQGQSVARNIAISMAGGQYLYFFDSDDILELNALEICYNKCLQENLDLVFFDADVFSDNDLAHYNVSIDYKRTTKYVDKVYTGIDILHIQLDTDGYSASPCLSLISRDFCTENRFFFYPYIIHEDELFTFILYLKAERVGLVNQIFFHRRIRPSSTMTTPYTLKNSIGYITVCRELKAYQGRYDTINEAKLLIRERISFLLNNLLQISKQNLSDIECEEIRRMVLCEFNGYINWKMRLWIHSPYLYRMLQQIKNFGKTLQ